jgi:VWFA-related protein
MAARGFSEWGAGRWVGVGVCSLMLAGSALPGQDSQRRAEEESAPTLRAYTDLVQIPVLVLGNDGEPVAAIAPQRFYVSLDGGPRFRVTHARLQGEDAMSLAIVMDLSEPYAKLEGRMDTAMAGMAPGYLHANDRVSIYAMDCGLQRAALAAPADAETLRARTELALEAWRAHGRMRWSKSCTKPVNLWDSLTMVTQELRQQPGRRAILVVTDGVDRGSKTTWNQLRLYAQASGVAIFGLTGAAYGVGDFSHSDGVAENIFRSMCGLTGGEVLTADVGSLGRRLDSFASVLRSRYIVEFPHAVDTKGGYHDMQITIEKSDVYVYAAGATIPVDDAAALNDPMRIQADPANVPQLGKRKIVSPQ